MPLTQLRVTIVEWIASTGEYKEWTPLNGQYVVSPSNTIAIPLLGEFSVANQTPSQVAGEISALLKQKTGLAESPAASVEVVRYPMFYVSGSVERAGELEYRPGLTVTQAVAMAGGRERRTDANGSRELEQLRYAGELNSFDLKLNQLMARRARLEAELAERTKIEFPPELVNALDGSAGRVFVQSETDLFVARAEALKRQLTSLSELQVQLQNEVNVLNEKTAVQDRQITIAEDELASISSLVDSGTLAKSRETALERVVADLSSDKLDLVIAAMRARQKLSETERDAIALKGQQRTEAGRELQEIVAEFEDTKLKRNTTIALLQATGAAISRDTARVATNTQALEYWVTRADGDGIPLKLPESAELAPGDVLDVRYDISATVASATPSAVGQPSQ
ncbi:polysaccharide biosynthesis/export family protein [Rhizobium rhizophilum]|nr:polysaccharide biosynthesis/export family protein [Rhizobium rhizophilum]